VTLDGMTKRHVLLSSGLVVLSLNACVGRIRDRIDDPARDASTNHAPTVDARSDSIAERASEQDARSVDVPASDTVADQAQPLFDAAPRLDGSLDSALADAFEDDSSTTPADVAADVPTVPTDAGPSSTRHTPRFIGWMGAPNGFYEYLPPTYDGATPHPLLVFWHGIGEDGNGSTELSWVLRNGPPRLIQNDTWPNDRPFIVLSPQHSGGGCPSADEIQAFITWALANYRVDTRQVFLTALSCGAIGSWQYITWHGTEQIAAAVLIAGDPGDPTANWSAWGHSMCALGDLAIWAIHGDADGTVNYGNENVTMNNLLACPSPPRRETHWNVIAGAGHDTWTSTYDLSYGFQIYDFLLRNPHP
jgi:hypothetical protein